MRLPAISGFARRTTLSITVYNVVYDCMVLVNSLFIDNFATSFYVGADGIAKVGYSNGFPGHSDRSFQRTDMDRAHRACKWFQRCFCDFANRFACLLTPFRPPSSTSPPPSPSRLRNNRHTIRELFESRLASLQSTHFDLLRWVGLAFKPIQEVVTNITAFIVCLVVTN